MNSNEKIRRLAECAVMTAVLCILSPLSIPIGPIPVTLGIFAVCLAIVVLGQKMALISIAAYLLLGLVGLPVFSGYAGGLAKLAGPTGGFLIGYLFTALVGGAITDRWGSSYVGLILGLAAGVAMAYLFGTIWFVVSTGATLFYALSVCVVPFIAIDAVKVAAAAFAGKAIRKALAKSGLMT